MKKIINILIILILHTILITAQSIQIDLKVFLEGPYNNNSMLTSLNSLLPADQPFSAPPWNYPGTEHVDPIPSDVVDWVLVELRDADNASQVVGTRAALLSNDGHVVDLDGSSPVSFDVENKDYFATVKSRNHLSVLSSAIVYNSTCPGIATVTYQGKLYNTVQIGDQCWLRENLDVGTRIDGNISMTDNATIEKYCFDDNASNCDTYGGLYQWDEAMQYVTIEGAQGLCPSGWHIPTHAEFQALSTIVSDDSDKLKAIGQGSGDGAGTNTSGFTALLGGYRSLGGSFFVSNYTNFWSSSEAGSTSSYNLFLDEGSTNITNGFNSKSYGFSVRCIKN